MLTYARTRGVNVDAILKEIGVPPSALNDYDRRIPEASRVRAWVEAAKQAHDYAFGVHVAEHAAIGSFDVLDYSLYFSRTLGGAFDHMQRFHRVLCDAWGFKSDVNACTVRVRRIERTPPPEAEGFFTLLVVRGRELTGVNLTPREVRFSHPAPAKTTDHEALFRCPVRFGSTDSEILFLASDLALPVRTANPGVGGVLDRYMTELLGRLPKTDSFVEIVRSVVLRSLGGGRPSLGKTARALHASPRTVQRRLGSHGTSYIELVESVRRDLAARLVAEGRKSVTETAYLLGFADVGSFRRAYKRWNGVAPGSALPPMAARHTPRTSRTSKAR
jgi:AraC-like DNA-binding protein